MSRLSDIMNVEGLEPLPSRTISTTQQKQSSQSLSQLPNQDTRYTDTRYPPEPLRLPPLESLSIPSPLSPQPLSSSPSTKRSCPSPKTSFVSTFGPFSGPNTTVGPGPNPSNPSLSPGQRPSVCTKYMAPRFSQERSLSPSAGYSSSYSDSMAGREVRRGMEAAEIGVRYTPVTGRISKAQKGLPVHKCRVCDRKPFSRAEHLRRHMTTHDPPTHLCHSPGCGKSFHRKDLLERHLERHNGPQTSSQSGDTKRRSRSSSHDFKAPKPPQTPPRPRPMGMIAGVSSYSSANVPAPITSSPMGASMSMMGPYTPETHRGYVSSYNEQSYPQVQQYNIPQHQLASPITMSMHVPSTYAEISPIVSCSGTSPMMAYDATSSSMPAAYHNSMLSTPYTSNACSFQHSYMPVSEAMETFSQQAQMMQQVSQRLMAGDLSVNVPHSTPGTAHAPSPLYHSDRDSNSNWSTPSDPHKSHIWPAPVLHDCAVSTPSSQYDGLPDMHMIYQQRMARAQQYTGQALAYGEAADFVICDEDQDRVSIAATYGTTDSEQDADYDQYQSEQDQLQLQLEAQGAQMQSQQQYMKDDNEWQDQTHWQM